MMERAAEDERSSPLRSVAELFAIDLRTLAFLRIYLGLVILTDLALRSRTLSALFSDEGLVPRADLLHVPPLFSLYTWSGSVTVEGLLLAVHAAVLVLFVLGLRTRLVTVAAFVLQGSLVARNPYVAGGDDLVPFQILLWSMFLPLGARWSLDARARRGAADERATRVVSVASAALTLQFVFLYVTGGLVKSGITWQDNTALLMSVSTEAWTLPFGRLLRTMPSVLAVATPAVLVLETYVPLLVFVPWRKALIRLLLIPTFVAFQFGLAISIELRLFPFVSSALAFVLIPGSAWDWLARTTGWAWLGAGDAGAGAAPRRAPRWQEAVVGLLLAMALVINVLTIARIRGIEPLARALQPVGDVGAQVGVMQRWDMYGPDPALRESRTELQGLTADGRSIAMLEVRAGEAWDDALFAHTTYRIRFYLEKLYSLHFRGTPLPARYLEWACRQWNASAPEENRIVVIRRIGVFRSLREGPSARTRRVPGPWMDCPGA